MKTTSTTSLIAVAAGLALATSATAQETLPMFRCSVGMTEHTPQHVIQHVALDPETAQQTSAQPVIEVVFVLDTTGSMGGLIEGAKQKIWSIANMMSTGTPTPTIRIGLVGYRDRGDEYVTTAVPMTDDLDMVYAKLTQFSAAGGGDSPESVNQGIAEAVNDTPWTEGDNVLRIIYLVGDAPPHMDYEQDIQYADTCETAARNGIIINTIQCGTMAATTPVWKEIAKLSEGAYFSIEQSGGVVAVTTPFDEELATLGVSLRETNMYYGDAEMNMRQAAREKVSASVDSAAGAAPSAAADRTVYLASKSGRSSLGAEQELLRDLEEGTVKLKDIKDDELPDMMKEMSEDERAAYVTEQQTMRAEVMEKIKTLNGQRTAFLKKASASQTERSSFDTSVLEAMRTQAVRAGIRFADDK